MTDEGDIQIMQENLEEFRKANSHLCSYLILLLVGGESDPDLADIQGEMVDLLKRYDDHIAEKAKQ